MLLFLSSLSNKTPNNKNYQTAYCRHYHSKRTPGAPQGAARSRPRSQQEARRRSPLPPSPINENLAGGQVTKGPNGRSLPGRGEEEEKSRNKCPPTNNLASPVFVVCTILSKRSLSDQWRLRQMWVWYPASQFRSQME